jgi:hypothetical protein
MSRHGRLSGLGAAILGLAGFWPAGAALAGPATYDRESRSFSFSYTFANLSTAGPTLNLAQVGQVQKPTAEQEQKVRALVKLVSDVMEQATQGRGKIGTLKYVDTIKDADLVISLTGQPASPGWAMLRATDGNPGQMALYYQSLEPRIRQEVVYTAVHEIFHYVFGLADEYDRSKFPGGCPPASGGPGCLMDNYNGPPGGRGYFGRLCKPGEHNSRPAQVQSCQEIVDKFFDDRKVEKSEVKPFVADERTTVIASAVAQVQSEVKSRPTRPPASSLTSRSRSILQEVIDLFNRNNPDKVTMTRQQIEQAARLIAQAASATPLPKPAGLPDALLAQLEDEARRVGADLAKEARKSESARISALRTHLRRFLDALMKTNNISQDAFGRAAQTALIDQLARAEGQDEQAKQLNRLVLQGELGLEMTRTIAGYIVEVLDELDRPGTPVRLGILEGFDERLAKLSIPGRTSSDWGTRRSRFITPSPSDAQWQYVETQGGVFPYQTLRDRGFEDFSRLINRARIELVRPRFLTNTDQQFDPISPRIDRPFEPMTAQELEAIRNRRNSDIDFFLADILDQLQRNRLENIAVLVPPGGLPPGLGDSLRVLESKLSPGLDVRLDLVLVGPVPIDTQLRHLSVRSRGSVLTIADIDEIGSIAQRLRDEQSSGAWVVVPQQSTIPQRRPVGVPQDPRGLLDTLRTDAATKWKEVAERIAKVRGQLQLIQAAGGNRTQAEQRRIENLIEVTTRLRDVFQRLDDRLQDRTGEELGNPGRADARRINQDYLVLIAEAGIDLEAARRHVAEALEATGSDPVTKGLRDVANSLVSPDSLGVELRAAAVLKHLHEKALEAALFATNDYVPIYARLDRGRIEEFRRGVEALSMPGGRDVFENRAVLSDRNTPEDQISREIRLARFYAEGDADFELILGLSRPLPRFYNPTTGRVGPRPIESKLVLFNDRGVPVDATTALRFNRGKSTETLLVWSVEAPNRLPAGWYTPFLRLDDETIRELKDNELNFTFSVGSARDNFQLIARLIEDENDAERGTVRPSDEKAIIEVQVIAGSPIRGAKVVGYYQRIDAGSREIFTQTVEFNDQGEEGGMLRRPIGERKAVFDRVKDDGIYTGAITLPSGAAGGAEYRVFIQAETIEGESRFIALDDPMQGKNLEADDTEERPSASLSRTASLRRTRQEETREAVRNQEREERKAVVRDTEKVEGVLPLKFQRATSLHFRFEP